MTARQRIEWLNSSWYGYLLVTGIGAGIFGGRSFLWAILGTACSLLVAFTLGRGLLNRSSLTRAVLLVISMLGMALGAMGLLYQTFVVVASFSLMAGLAAVMTILQVMMHLRTYRVLKDSSVKAYISA